MAPRVLQLTSNDEAGGVRTLVETIEAGLRARGFEVVTLSLSVKANLPAKLAHLLASARFILASRPDAILCYQAAASVLGCTLGWIARTRVRAAHQTALPEAVRPLWRELDRLLGTLGVYTHIVSNSLATRATFSRYPLRYRQRFVNILHGVVPLCAKGAVDWRTRLNIVPNAPLLVATGRLTRQKNHAVAIAALAFLPHAHLVVAGDGPDRQRLASLAENRGISRRLHLIGTLAREDLGDLLTTCDIYLFPSTWETFGIAGVEAAMTGLPVVASDLPVLREVLGGLNPDLVRFHAVDDPRQLADEVAALIARYPDAQQRRQLADAALARHGVAAMIAHYEALVRDAPAAQSPPRMP